MRPWTKLDTRRTGLAALIVIGLIVADQFVKYLAFHHLRGERPINYLGGLITVEYAENRGAFLSLGAALSEQARWWIFVIGVVLILGFCVYSLFKSLRHLPSVIALSLVIAGGIGNLIDRVLQGYVVDYVHMGVGGIRTGVFNVADVAISAGLLLLVFWQYRGSGDTGPAK